MQTCHMVLPQSPVQYSARIKKYKNMQYYQKHCNLHCIMHIHNTDNTDKSCFPTAVCRPVKCTRISLTEVLSVKNIAILPCTATLYTWNALCTPHRYICRHANFVIIQKSLLANGQEDKKAGPYLPPMTLKALRILPDDAIQWPLTLTWFWVLSVVGWFCMFIGGYFTRPCSV